MPCSLTVKLIVTVAMALASLQCSKLQSKECAVLRNARGNDWGSSGWTTTEVAAASLGVTPRTIRSYIQQGELVGELEGKGIEQAWRVSIASLEELRDNRKAQGKFNRRIRKSSALEEDIADIIESLSARLETRVAEAADLKARLELTAKAESTLQAERDRLVSDLDREREERQRERERAEQLQAELEAERSRGFWQRLFGG
jgi:chromosome segregation ATPase